MALKLEEICALIPNFDGHKENYVAFRRACERAFTCVSDKTHLNYIVSFILTKLGNAVEELPETLKTWSDIRDRLDEIYLDRLSIDRLEFDLVTILQLPAETVLDFKQRIDRLQKNLFTLLENDNVKDYFKKRILSKFVNGLHPSIRIIVVCQKPTTLSEAFKLAASEEEYLNFNQDNFIKTNKIPLVRRIKTILKCFYCNKNGHIKKHCKFFHNKNKHFDSNKINVKSNNLSIPVSVNDKETIALIDTGADVNLISSDQIFEHQNDKNQSIEISGISNKNISTIGKVNIPIVIDGIPVSSEFHVVNPEVLGDFGVFLGTQFLEENNAILNYRTKRIQFDKDKGNLPFQNYNRIIDLDDMI